MTRLRKHTTITGILFFSICAVLVLSHYITMSSAWTQDEIIVPVGDIPIIDGIQDAAWNKANVTKSGEIDIINLKAMINSSYLFILVEIQATNHDDDEYIKLLLSNSSDFEDEDFIDAKLIQTRNFSKADNRSYIITDQVYYEGEYISDNQTNFVGAANISAGNKYSYYEFSIPFASVNNDTLNDTSIVLGNTFALKVEFGIHKEDQSPTSVERTEELLITLEKKEGGGNGDIEEFPLNLKILSYVMFSITGVAFIVIAVITFQSRSKI
ncbi:MAG: hypothetical protein JW776_03740 [Candidatus Lokiarchaeota archaeon]|nr:hypothetical protein [Candidatus Lokiarchaeota archaeon]